MKTKTKRNALKRTKKSSLILAILLLAGYLTYDYLQGVQGVSQTTSDVVTFSKCTDGDTAHFVVNGNDETVRFLAIDTPETVKPNTPVQPYGKEASDYTCNRIKEAKEIQLEYEESNKTDKYGRALAWVWVDGSLLQLELINKGYAEVAYIYGDYKYTDQLKGAQEHAQTEKIGKWK